MRIDGRGFDQLRPVKLTRSYTKHAEGSVLVETGDTIVLCNASVEDRLPPFKMNSGEGWVTAEYAMLPRATGTRNPRDISKLKLNSRSQEIQRLIGRSLRSVIDLKVLGEKLITLDCDVIQADGGTRTASITGAFVALVDACIVLLDAGVIAAMPVRDFVAATSVGVIDGQAMLDLCYAEDSNAQVDMNVVMDSRGRFIEIQATGEKTPFERDEFEELMGLAQTGINNLISIQKEALGKDAEFIGSAGL